MNHRRMGMKRATVFLMANAVTFMTAHSWAQEHGSPWEVDAELGYVQTNGNTKNKTLNGKLTGKHEVEKWRHKLQLEAMNTADRNSTTGEKYLLSGKTDYKFTDKAYAFAMATYEDDRFSGFEYQATATLGAGYRVLDQNKMTLDLEGGPGYRNANPKAGDTINEALLRLAADYKWKITDHSKFSEELSAEIGEETDTYKSVTALSSQIEGNLAMKLSYTVKHQTEVPAGSKKTDTETAVTLVYTF